MHVVAALAAGFALARSAHAEEAEPAGHDGHAAHEGGEHAEGEPEEHEHHQNHLAIFLGASTTLAEGHATDFAIGADYERRLHVAGGKLGAGLLIDLANGDELETLAAPFLSFHPFGGLIVLGAVGVSVTGAAHDPHVAFRGSAAYFVHAATFSIGPVVSIDRVRETAIVYGLAVGAGF